MNKIILILVLFVSAAGCKTPPLTKVPVYNTDVRTEVVEIIRDSIVSIPPDSAWLKALLACDSMGNVYLDAIKEYEQGEKIKIPVPIVKENIITVTASADSSEIFLKWKERHTSRDSIRVITLPPVEINRPTGWQWFQIWCGRMLFVAFAATSVTAMVKRSKK